MMNEHKFTGSHSAPAPNKERMAHPLSEAQGLPPSALVKYTSGAADSNGATSESKKRNDGRQRLGRLGERLAAGALVKHGYRVLEQNFRCRSGEIDIVAEEGADLVFVEVKTRRGQSYGLPEEAVTWRKARKLAEVASCYLDLHACPDRSWRIDVVAVQFSSDGKMQEIRIYQHAITES